MSRQSTPFPITAIGIEIGKNTFHLVGLESRRKHRLAIACSRNRSKTHNSGQIVQCFAPVRMRAS
jgi:hypothetical protein